MGLAFVFLASCYWHDHNHGCFEPNLRLWCMDTLARDRGEPPCGEPTGAPSYRCGPYDVVSSPPDYTGVVHYFEHDSGEHVATMYWSDLRDQCGGFESWYGRRIDCRPTCAYDENQDDGLPLCH